MIDYRVCLTTKVNPKTLQQSSSSKSIIVIEIEDYEPSEIQEIRRKGYRVLGYLSLGTNEKSRSWYEFYSKYNLSRLEDWPDEYYVDVRRSEWRGHLVSVAKQYKAMGVDGFWLDNLDVYEYHKSTSMYNSCVLALERIKKEVGGYIMVNGGSEFFDKFMDKDTKHKGLPSVDGVTQEEVYSLIKNYDKKDENSGKKGIFGEQKSNMHRWYQSYMKRLRRHLFDTFLLEYTRSDSLKKRIDNFCTKYKMTGRCVSDDVDL